MIEEKLQNWFPQQRIVDEMKITVPRFTAISHHILDRKIEIPIKYVVAIAVAIPVG